MRRRSSIRLVVSWFSLVALGLACAITPAPAQEKPAAPEKAAATEPESALPPGYEPPIDPPEVMLIEKTLLSDEERKALQPIFRKKYLPRVRSGDLRSEAAKQEAIAGIQYQLNELTIPSNRRDLTKLRARITGASGSLQQAGRFLTKPDQIMDFRRQLLQLVVEQTQRLFDNNFHVRVQAALILGELNLIEEDPTKDIKALAYPPAYKPLCQVLQDPEQPEGLKIVCTLSLIRIMNRGNPDAAQRREIAQAIVSELKRTDTDPWYQSRLAQALGFADVVIDLDRQPFVYDCLMAVVKDPNRPLRTRVQAAWSLGRHPEKGPDPARTVAEVAALGYELAKAQAADPKDSVSRRCALILYLAFEKRDDQDLDAKRDANRKGGLLNHPTTKAAAEQAFPKVLPVVRELIGKKSPSLEQVQDLGKWLESQGLNQAPAEKPKAIEKPKAKNPETEQPADDAVGGQLAPGN